MFDIGWSELLVVAVVAIIFIGPRELVPMLRTFGQYAGKLKRMAGEFQSQFDEALREAELDQITKEVEEVRKASPIGDIQRQVESDMKPIGATMEDIARPIKAPAEDTPAKGEPGAKEDASKPQPAAAKGASQTGSKPAPKPAPKTRHKPAPKRAPKPAAKRAAGSSGRDGA